MNPQEKFFELVKNPALEACREYEFKIVSLPISQSAIESGWMKSSLAYKYNNLLGRKWKNNNVITKKYKVFKTQEWDGTKYVTKFCKFCIYDSIKDCFKDYIWLFHNTYLDKKKTKLRYQRVLDSKDYLEATENIRLCGYATSPTYTQSLRTVIERYKLNQYDT
ncbi:MAG: glycoside hydrolase family 73 protein [Candidatus Humimicrobiaceae bacterium]